MDSYEIFLARFKIEKRDFFNWGISATIFPPINEVKKEWDNLKIRIRNNEAVFIRGYGRDARGTNLYKDFYKSVFGNHNVEKDSSNNAAPQKLIAKLTGMNKNQDLFNYQVSHIWGHTKNIFMFESPWNICYVPKIMDPFTGHESKGSFPSEYKAIFISKALELYRPFILEYNELLEELDIDNKIDQYLLDLKLRGEIPAKILAQFKKDIKAEFSKIEID